MDETWKAIEGYVGLYDVSNRGRIRSHDRVVNRKNGSVHWKGRVLKPQRGSKGHYGVNLHKDGVSQTNYIHRLVASAFIPNPLGHPLVRHLDDVKENNAADNLAWGTHADNAQDAIRNGRDFNRQAGKTHCPKNHPYSGENLYRDPTGRRHCRECRRQYQRTEGKEKARIRRTRGLPDGDPRHGTLSGYTNYGCTCAGCQEARKLNTTLRKKEKNND